MTVNIGILTSSRADYSIYFPLIKALEKLPNTSVDIIAFGTHLSEKYGYTVNQILADGFEVLHRIENTFALGDSPKDISDAMGNTLLQFSKFWQSNQFDLVFCLGDRYEMFAAVSASVPFQVKIAHLYGGEKTEGAIDDCLRHALSVMSKYHFAACEAYKNRVIELISNAENVFNFGHLSIDNLERLPLLNIEELQIKTGVDFAKQTILCTFHPETVNYESNTRYAQEICDAFSELTEFQILITMPNSDTGGAIIRSSIEKLAESNPNIITTENLGTIGYLSAMKYCKMMVGNTSSGFVEASYFPTTVINLGERQTGRIITPNIFNTPIQKQQIIDAVRKNINNTYENTKIQIYGSGNTAELICNELQYNLLKSSYLND
jgi:GDP/UDP-N,N'-diacetylbacillosamine 2-epimerase (hydrolysing)